MTTSWRPSEDLCGIPVITTIDIIENIKVRLGKNGFPLFKTTGPGTLTSTNPATGKSVVEPSPVPPRT